MKNRLRKIKRRRGWPHELVPMAAIRRLAREIAVKFYPEEIILFGSYAYGKPSPDSDVDLLVVMPAKDERSQASQIREATDHPFPLDLIVRTPKNLAWRLQEEDWFLREIMSKGKTLYEKNHSAMDRQGRKGFRGDNHRVQTAGSGG